MVHPRVVLASGFAALAAGIFVLAGIVDAPVPVVVALLLAARAAAPAAAEGGARSLARLAGSVPAWVGIAIVAVVRAGSTSLADARGANAVAGSALTRGSLLIVIACWAAILAAVIAIVPVAVDAAHRELDLAAIGVQIALAVSLFAGPQISHVGDVVPWAAALIILGAFVWKARALARWDWMPKAATGLAAVAVGLALAAPRL